MPATDASLVSLFEDRVQRSGPQKALWIKRSGNFIPISWDELAADVHRMAGVLVELGVQPGDRVIQLSENRYEWVVADLAILFAGAVHVPVHATLAAAQVAYQVRDCGARVVLVSTPQQAAKLGPLATQLRVFCYETDWPTAASTTRPPSASPSPDQLASILYTSGTTGEPKGVMLSHANLLSNALATLDAFTIEPEDLRLTWLPLSHIFARTCDMYVWIAAGNQLALAESRETILADCAAIRPTLMNGVPYFFDKVQRVLVEKGAANMPGKLQEIFGGRLRCLCSGGAALADHTAQFYLDRGLTLVQGYGLTESSPVITAGTPAVHKVGTVGKPLKGVEVRIAEDGEVLARGPNIMLGYWQKPEETAAVLKDGWLYTGDLGELDEEGFLKITGRKKELIVTAAGKNIAPVYLEALLTEDPLIEQALVIGDGRNYLVALIVPNQQALEAALPGRPKLADLGNWREDPQVRALVEQRIAQRLADVSPGEQVRKFALLDRPFGVESGELTPTLKLRRGVICSQYADLIEQMYA